MINKEHRESIKQGITDDRYEEKEKEEMLYLDEEYALQQIADDDLIDIRSMLAVLSEDMGQCGWDTTVSELIERLKDL